MKYIITGSLGNISKPVTEKLVAAGHSVTVITSRASNISNIESLGATAAVGSVEDAAFISQTFKGADAVYLMIPPHFGVTDWYAHQVAVSQNYVAAITANGIKHVVVLSSIGAHMRKGAGPIDGLGYLESEIEKLSGVHAKFLRPSYFITNLFQQAGMIKHAGIMGSAQPADHQMVLVHPSDIAVVAAEELENLSFTGHNVRYIAGDERTWKEITEVLSAAVGKAGTPYVEFTDEQSYEGMLQAGLSAEIAKGYRNMGAALRSKQVEADYWNNRPVLGKVKLEDFAKEFTATYNAS
ncbi:MAG: NmrA family NAD(P)-binding protein [Bacteroidota bacterium]